MVEGFEGAGEAATGTLAAAAVEPRSGGGHGVGAGEACLNCGATVDHEYCGRCGQAAHVHRTLGAFWHDIAHSVLHFDGKIWRTLPLLAWHPGELTRRYVEGERAKFVSPMALFLFSVFLMFAVVSAFGGPMDLGAGDRGSEERTEANDGLRREIAQNESELGVRRGELAAAKAAGKPARPIEEKIQELERELQVQKRAQAMTARLITQEAAPEVAKPEPAEREAAEQINLIGETGWPALDQAVAKAEKNPSLLFYKLQTNAYKFSWALIPISVPFLWMLFLHRRRYWRYKAYDHIVFVTYSISFMTIGFIVLTLLRPLGAGETIIGLGISFGPPIHMYRQLRGAYRLSRWSAIWRTFVLLIFASIAASLFLTLLLALGVLG